jgi:hypothetical protein
MVQEYLRTKRSGDISRHDTGLESLAKRDLP